MVLKTFDGKEIYVTKDQAEKIADLIKTGTKMIEINSGSTRVYVAAGAVATITSGGEPPKQDTPRIAAKAGETLEQVEARLARNREKLADMKKNLISKGVIKA